MSSAFAQRLTEQQAKERAASFLMSKRGTALAKGAGVKASGLTTVSLGIDGVYVFNVDGGGYVVAGGDSRVAPVLGFGDNGTLNAADVPANMKAWLEGYARQAAFAAENNLDYKVSSASSDHEPIEPMLKTNWGQHEPFNRLCPLAYPDDPSKGRCVAGCVATAMAQVANYHKWPVKAEGIGHATDLDDNSYEIDMSNDYFDWDNMLDVYTNEKKEIVAGNETQWDAVALLIRDMAYCVNMTFSPKGSGATRNIIPFAMVNNLGYDKGAHAEYRDWYTDEEWDNMIYENLSEYGPLIYCGETKDSEGHAFVCDGYRGDGYYHFNWGWNGESDGYFLLSSLNPDHLGNEGIVKEYAFDYDQDAVFGLCKPREGSQAVVNVSVWTQLYVIDGDIACFLEYDVTQPEEIEIGVWTKDIDSEEEDYHFVEKTTFEKPTLYIAFPNNFELPDGEYKVRLTFRRAGEEEWRFVRCSRHYKNYLLLKVENGEKTFYTDEPTSVEGINAAGTPKDNRSYDLLGKPATKSSNLRILIVNGKKVVKGK